jgi:hypothetical protein
MKKPWLSRFIWWFWIYFFRVVGLPFRLSPLKLPQNEGKKFCQSALDNSILIIFNPGGWGDATIEQADDFSPVLEGIQNTLKKLGCRSKAVAYTRTLSGPAGRLAGIREQYNSFKHSSRIMAKEIRYLAQCFPEKRILIVGFSIGGALTGKAMSQLQDLPGVYGITVGVPGWLYTYRSDKSLVLNNSGQDPLCAGDSNAIAMAVIKSPFRWWEARKNGHKINIALAIQIPHHEYSWSSPEVHIPIDEFLKNHF